jgi:hypothetical protein
MRIVWSVDFNPDPSFDSVLQVASEVLLGSLLSKRPIKEDRIASSSPIRFVVEVS